MNTPSASARALEAKLISYLERFGPCTSSVLIRATDSHAFPVTGVLKRLIREGLVVKLDANAGPRTRYDLTARRKAATVTREPKPEVEIEEEPEFDPDNWVVTRKELIELRTEFATAMTHWAGRVIKLEQDIAELEYRTAPRETQP